MINMDNIEIYKYAPFLSFDKVEYTDELIEKNIIMNGGFHPGRTLGMLIRDNGNKTQKLHDLLMSNSIIENDSILFPYFFDFNIHANIRETLSLGWISGMCQGLALLYYSTMTNVLTFGDLDRIRNSLTDNRILEKEGDSFHFHEYQRKCDALNGHIFALMGLYSHWNKTSDTTTLELLEKGIKWVIEHFSEYRNQGNASFYCRTHRMLSDKVGGKYHAVHIDQMIFLYAITRDIIFNEFAKQLCDDFKCERRHMLPI